MHRDGHNNIVKEHGVWLLLVCEFTQLENYIT